MNLFGWLFTNRSAKASHESNGSDDNAEASAQDSTVAGERGIASINRARSAQSRVSNLLAMGLMSALGLGLLTWYYAQMFSRQAHARQDAQAASRSKAQGEMALPALGRVDPPPPAPLESDPSAVERVLGPQPDLPSAPSSTAYLAPGASGATPVQAPARALDRRLAGPVFSEPPDGGTGSARNAATTIVAAAPAESWEGATAMNEGSGAAAAPGNDRGVATLLRPSVTPAVRARVLPTQQMLLPKGAFIDCTLETAIDSSLPGLTTCITATDTFGVDGRVVLLERGTKLVGETRGEVQQGSVRVFVLWTEARTPAGVIVPLASPGTDELGRSGLPGTVDRHFLERFGAALLISVIDGAVQAAVQSRSNGGTVIYNPSSSQDVLTEILKSTVNIAPTVRKQNGDRIQVLVARDLDFRSVYELRSVATAR
jgi:type IV secretion system protein VirB10